MIDFSRGAGGLFSSSSLGAHLLRGAFAAILFAGAVRWQSDAPWLSMGLGLLALVALRGCPMCWTVGLIETLAAKSRRRR